MNSFDPEKYLGLLKSEFGTVFYYHASLDSTNQFLKTLAAEEEGEGSVALAEEQTAGRGRWGRSWEGSSKSLLVSLLLRPQAGAPVSQLAAVMGLAVLRALRAHAPQARLKWPNDIWVADKKLSGLLLEGSEGAIVVGLGLNVNQDEKDFSAELNATSLKILAGRELEREALLAELLFQIERSYKEWQAEGFEKLRREWDENACFIGEMVQAGELKGRAMGLAEDGALILETGKGLQHLSSGEVSALRPA